MARRKIILPSVKTITSGVSHALLTPWWVAELLTAAKSFEKNPIIGSLMLNRLGLHVSRMRFAHFMSDRRRRRLAHLVSATDRADFHRDGFVMKRNFLSHTAFKALHQEVMTCAAPARDMLQGNAVTRRIALDIRTLANLPATRKLLNDSDWLGLMRYVAASALMPLNYIQTIFTQARGHGADPQTLLHADTFHPTAKAWLFLTDVAADAGSFTYVPGSHRLTPKRVEWEHTMSLRASQAADKQTREGSFRILPTDLGQLGLPAPRVFAVPANTLVIADTFGFHARGASLHPSVRVEIWGYARRNPFLPWTGFDPTALPGVKDRAIPLFWWGSDVLERLGVRKNPWRRAGIVTPQVPPDLGQLRSK